MPAAGPSPRPDIATGISTVLRSAERRPVSGTVKCRQGFVGRLARFFKRLDMATRETETGCGDKGQRVGVNTYLGL